MFSVNPVPTCHPILVLIDKGGNILRGAESLWDFWDNTGLKNAQDRLPAVLFKDIQDLMARAASVSPLQMEKKYLIGQSKRWLRLVVIPKQEHTELILTDIQAERSHLSRAELAYKHYESLFHRSPDAVYQLDFDGCFIDLNEQTAVLAGASREELLGQSFIPLIHPSDLERISQKNKEVLEGTSQFYEGVRISNYQGKQYWVDITDIPLIVDGEVVGIQGVAKNVTERELRKQEVQSLIEQAPGGVFQFEVDEDGMLSMTFHNQLYVEILGLKKIAPGPIFNWSEIATKEEIFRVLNTIYEAARKSSNWNIDAQVHHHELGERWIRVVGSPIKHQNKTVFNGFIYDITSERIKQSFYAFRSQVLTTFNRAHTLADAIEWLGNKLLDEGDFYFIEIWRVTATTHFSGKSFGPEDLRHQFHHTREDSRAYAPLGNMQGEGLSAMAFQQKEPIWIDDIGNSNSPNKEWAISSGLKGVQVVPVLFEGSVIALFYGFRRDSKKPNAFTNLVIDWLHNALGAYIMRLKESEEKHRILANSPDGIAMLDYEGAVSYLNPVAKRFFDGSNTDIRSAKVFDLVHPGDRKKLRKAWTSTIGKTNQQVTTRITRADGSVSWMEWRLHDLPDEYQVITVIRDVTKTIIDQQKQHGLIADLRKTNKHLNEFSFILSHNLRGPLSNIVGLVDLIHIGQTPDNEVEEYLQLIARSAQQVNNTMEELAPLLNSGDRKRSSFRVCSLPQLWDEFYQNNKAAINRVSRDIFINFHQAPFVYFNPDSLENVFLLLCGSVGVFQKKDDRFSIQITSSKPEKRVILEFSIKLVDKNALEIPPTDLLKSTIYTDQLHSARKLLEASGASLQVEWSAGFEGSYIIHFPVQDQIRL